MAIYADRYFYPIFLCPHSLSLASAIFSILSNCYFRYFVFCLCAILRSASIRIFYFPFCRLLFSLFIFPQFGSFLLSHFLAIFLILFCNNINFFSLEIFFTPVFHSDFSKNCFIFRFSILYFTLPVFFFFFYYCYFFFILSVY